MYLSKKSEALSYFNSVLKELKKSKVKAIFTLSSPSWNYHRGFRSYMDDTEVYILLENDNCLVIDYRFIDFLEVEYRKLTEEELAIYDDLMIQDCFNTVNDITDFRTGKIYKTETCELEYSNIEEILLRSITREYWKWIDGDLDSVEPTEETFDEIKFTMNNGKSFVICADGAESDGYVLFWSEDTKETVVKR